MSAIVDPFAPPPAGPGAGAGAGIVDPFASANTDTTDQRSGQPKATLQRPAGAAGWVKDQIGGHGADYGSGIGYLADNPITRGLGGAANELATGAAELGQHAVGVVSPTGAAWLKRNVTQPLAQRQQSFEAPEDAGVGSDITQAAAGLAGTLAFAGMTGGAGEAPEAAAAAKGIAGKVAPFLTRRALMSAAPIGFAQAGAAGAQQEAQGQDVTGLGLVGRGVVNTAANLVPLGGKGGVLKRMAKGALAGEGVNEAVNLVNGQPLGTGALMATAMGAGFGLIPHAAPGSLSDAANAVHEENAKAEAGTVPSPSAATTSANGPDTPPGAASDRIDPGLPPWSDPDSGEVTAPTRDQLHSALAAHMAAQFKATGDMRVNNQQIADAWGVPVGDVAKARRPAELMADEQIRQARTQRPSAASEVDTTQTVDQAAPPGQAPDEDSGSPAPEPATASQLRTTAQVSLDRLNTLRTMRAFMPSEQATHDWLTAHADDPEALAARLGRQLVPDEDSIIDGAAAGTPEAATPESATEAGADERMAQAVGDNRAAPTNDASGADNSQVAPDNLQVAPQSSRVPPPIPGDSLSRLTSPDQLAVSAMYAPTSEAADAILKRAKEKGAHDSTIVAVKDALTHTPAPMDAKTVRAAASKAKAEGREPGQPSHAWGKLTPADVPLAGAAKGDLSGGYVDPRVPKTVDVDGKTIPTEPGIRLHENVESHLMHERGFGYQAAHAIAQASENKFIRDTYGVDPDKYQNAMTAGIEAARKQAPKGDAIPADLDEKPYADTGLKKLVDNKPQPDEEPPHEPEAPEQPAGAPAATERTDAASHDRSPAESSGETPRESTPGAQPAPAGAHAKGGGEGQADAGTPARDTSRGDAAEPAPADAASRARELSYKDWVAAEKAAAAKTKEAAELAHAKAKGRVFRASEKLKGKLTKAQRAAAMKEHDDARQEMLANLPERLPKPDTSRETYDRLRASAPPEIRPKAEQAQGQATHPETPPKGGVPASKANASLDDFGEKLEGARKFLPPSLREKVSDEDIASQPLSKIWPADAYKEIEDPAAAALAYTFREHVPAKPRVDYKVRRWVEQVKTLRSTLLNLHELGDLGEAQKIAAQYGSGMSEVIAKAQLLAQLPRDTWGRVDRVGEYPGAERYEGHKPIPVPFSSVTIDGKTTTFDGVGHIGPDEVAKVKAMLAGASAKDGPDGLTSQDFDVYRRTNRPEAFITRKADREKRPLITFHGDDALKQARAYAKDHVKDLSDAWEKVKSRDNVREAETRRDANETRKATDWRQGKDATPEMFDKAFGFRGVQFGNWVKQGKGSKDRQTLLNDTYDALHDLSSLIGVPTRALSLDGQLGLALGARGSGKAAAHFEPTNLVINLTKTRGAGSLAHEWFHALDNYFSRMRPGGHEFKGNQQAFREANYITYKPEPLLSFRSPDGRRAAIGDLTRAELKRRHQQQSSASLYDPKNWVPSTDHPQGVRPEVERAFAELVQALNDSPMAARAAAIDGVKASRSGIAADGYWSRIIERGARSFENYVISKMAQRGISNDFLANIRDWEGWKALGKNEDRYPYLKPEEEAPITRAFDHLFDTVKTEEQPNGNVRLFQLAWHGTPHRGIEKHGFQFNRIGTGEGAQAYGWGTYFAGKKAVAEFYRAALSRTANAYAATDDAGRWNVYARKAGGGPGAGDELVAGPFESQKEASNRALALRTSDDAGQLYRADIPEDHEMLDWDRPLGEQPAQVREALRRLIADREDGNARLHIAHNDPTGEEIYRGLTTIKSAQNRAGAVEVSDPKAASEYLNSIGIPGLRYLDGQSRRRPLKDVKREFLAELPEDATNAEVQAKIGTGTFSPKNDALLKALAADDWLGFDYPAQALSAALGGELDNYDASPALRHAVSAAQEGGTHNYVIWDESRLSPAAAKIEALYRQTNGDAGEAGVNGRGQPTTQHVNGVRSFVNGLTKGWKGDDVPDVKVVPTAEDLPNAMKVDAKGAPDPTYKAARGAYDGKTIYLVANRHRIDTPEGRRQLHMTTAHEAIGHYGVERIVVRELGADAWTKIQHDLLAREADGKGGDALKSVFADVRRRYGADVDDKTFAKESLAVMAERGLHNGILQKVYAAVRSWLRKFMPSLQLNDADLRRLLAKSQEFLERGQTSREKVQARAALAFSKDGAPLRTARTFKEAREQAAAYRGKPLTNHETGMSVVVSRNSLDKMLSNKAVSKSSDAKLQSMAVANLDTLFANATLGWSKPDNAHDSNIVAIHRLFAPMKSDGRMVMTKMTVKETAGPEGNPLYSVEAVDLNEKRPAATWVAAAANADGIDPTSTRSAGRVMKLAQEVQDFNAHPNQQFSKADVTDTPAFHEFFDGSKVVDQDGQPLPVYHGTAEDFPVFKDARSGSATQHATSPLGHFFTPDIRQAKGYARNASEGRPADERVVDAYLNIRKPYTMSLKQAQAIESPGMARAVRAQLEAKGYDGIHLPEQNAWVAFHSEQIKSASGNRGTFDAKNPNIYFDRTAAAGDDDKRPFQHPDTRAAESIETLSATLPKLDESAWQRAGSWLHGKWIDAEPKLLGALQLRHVLELGQDIPELKAGMRAFGDQFQAMDADRNAMQVDGAAKVKQLNDWAFHKGLVGWRGKLKPEAKRLFQFMHKVTQLRLDPSNAYEKLLMRNGQGEMVPWTKDLIKQRVDILHEVIRGRSGDAKDEIMDEIKDLESLPRREAARLAQYPALEAAWNELSPKAQEMFRMMRDHYQEQADQMEKARDAQIAAMEDITAQTRAVLRLKNQEMFDDQRQSGVYFPLQRFGDFWIAAETPDITDKDGNVTKAGDYTFTKYESAREARDAEKRMRAGGWGIQMRGRQVKDFENQRPVTGTFMAGVQRVVRESGAPQKVQDELNQMFLKTLPELSLRKRGIHRYNVAGYTDNVPRVFATSVLHGSHQIAKARYGYQLQNTLEHLRERLEAKRAHMDVNRAAHADALVSEIDKRNNWIMNPTSNKLVTMINQIGFHYYLAASPASAVVNIAQTPMVTLPVLAAQHGWDKAPGVLLGAFRDAVRSGGNLRKYLKDDEDRLAFDTLSKAGTFTRTQTHTLGGVADDNPLTMSPAWGKVMGALGYMFQKAEEVNRQAAGIAAFRLARMEGKSVQESIRHADDIVNGTHFDYSNANRSPWMQSSVGKVVGQFKSYSLGMTWLYWRNLYQAVKAEDPEVRRVAQRTLAGILGMAGVFAGFLGTPLSNLIATGSNIYHTAFGDKDERFDFKEQFFKWLQNHMGTTAANTIAYGPASQIGANVASRLSASDMWFRDVDQNISGDYAYIEFLQEMAGPLGGIVQNVIRGNDQINKGYTERGIESMMPTVIKNVMKGYRYATQGANTLRGAPIVDDMDTHDAVIQALGFQPTKVAEQQRANDITTNDKSFIEERRQGLMNAFAMAYTHGTPDERADALKQIADFNHRYPVMGISMIALTHSLQQRARTVAETKNGMHIKGRIAAQLAADAKAEAAQADDD